MYTLHLCDKVCQWLAPGWWFSLGTPVSSTNKTNCHDITEILLNMSLNIINHYDLRQSFVITEKYCNNHLYICMLIHQTVKLYRKLDVLSELEYTLNFHFNLDSDTDPKLHSWYTWRDYPLHWYMRWRNKWKKNCDILPFFFVKFCNMSFRNNAWCKMLILNKIINI